MLILKNGRIIDPKRGVDEIGDIYIENGKIAAPVPDCAGAEVIDCAGLVIAPGFVDLHVHFRDPGQTHKEDLATGSAAAAAGGVTAVLCMPNTKPVTDTAERLLELSARCGEMPVRILPYAAVTVGQKGEELTDFDALKKADVVALSDDGLPIMSECVMRDALIAAKALGLTVCTHCEDAELVKNHAVNEGEVSKILGIPGRPAIAEEAMIERDCALALETGARVHICHVSTARSADIIRRAKAAGAPVTAETCPQYFTLTERAILEKGTLARVNPPLRTDADVLGIAEALRDGTLDALATDHAPHAAEEKAKPLVDAPSGMVGLETSLALAITRLVGVFGFSLPDVVRLLSSAPADVLGLPFGSLDVGAPADVAVFDPEEKWTVDPEKLHSKSKNTPFGGMELTGRVKYTICRGKVVFAAQ